MGLIYADIELSNPKDTALKPLAAKALVDTGALHLYVPEHMALQLGLEEIEKREVTMADGAKKLIPYVGPVQIRFENRSCFTGALVLGEEVLLGAVPREDMDILVSPAQQSVVVNPESPNIPASVVK